MIIIFFARLCYELLKIKKEKTIIKFEKITTINT